ncbi:hypothetical protein OF83DRAFT_1173468 [Amylostereum chailletii]|nr:hypothetical protein OF83DRAFT_1173468 [Amylostereum chailletii]
MTSITRNLPWFIKDLGISVVGEKCYVSLVENLDVNDFACIHHSASKVLGIGIVVGGSIMKIPQLFTILRNHSTRGLSLPSFALETLAYAITTTYSWRNQFPFSTYGENLFLSIQNVLITLLILAYAAPAAPRLTAEPNHTPRVLAGVATTLATGFALAAAPSPILSLLQIATLPLSVFSKLPQIVQNQRARSTGQLSTFAVLSQVLGCAVRLFTTAAEVSDVVVAAGFALALALNLVVAAQMWAFWGRDLPSADARGPARDAGAEEKLPERAYGRDKFDIVVPPQSPLAQQTSHRPQPSLTQAQPGRRWARKVD